VVAILWALSVFLMLFCFVVFFGAPYVPSFSKDLEKIFSEVNIPKSGLVVDLGSGDGRFLVLAAHKGYSVVGYEINPVLWLISKARLRRYPKARVKLKSLWRADVSEADLVFTFLATKFMPKLEKKLNPEMKTGSYLASYIFELPSLAITKKNTNTHFYKF